jgi:putative ABC transport system substrate-binding protein
LARPGGNITGLSLQQVDLAAKRLELLREVIPKLRTLAVLFNGGYSSSLSEVRKVAAPAQRLGIGVVPLEIRRSEDVVSAIDATRGRVEALYVVSEPLVSANRMRINTMALGLQMPTMHAFREYVETGGLMSYGPNLTDMWRRSADYVDKILRGTNASEIPVEQPTKFDLILNLTTAKALGLTVPPTVLAQANEVIE